MENIDRSATRAIFSPAKGLMALAMAAFALLAAQPAAATRSYVLEFQPSYTMLTTDSSVDITATLKNTGTDFIAIFYVGLYVGLDIQDLGGYAYAPSNNQSVAFVLPGQNYTFTFATIDFPNAPVGTYDALYSSDEDSYWPVIQIGYSGGAEFYFLKNMTLPKVVVQAPAAPPVEPSAPEPATWATLVLGFGASGWALRRARRAKPCAPLIA